MSTVSKSGKPLLEVIWEPMPGNGTVNQLLHAVGEEIIRALGVPAHLLAGGNYASSLVPEPNPPETEQVRLICDTILGTSIAR